MTSIKADNAVELRDDISNDVIAKAEQLQAFATMGDAGVINIDDSKENVKSLLGEMSLDDIIKAQKALTLLGDAHALVVGEMANEAFAKDKSLERVQSTFNVGQMRVQSVYDRTRTVRDMADKTKVTVHNGGLNSKVTFHNQGGKGQRKKVKSYLYAAAAAAY